MPWDKAKFAEIEVKVEAFKQDPQFKTNKALADLAWTIQTLREVGLEHEALQKENEELKTKLAAQQSSHVGPWGEDDEETC